MRSVLLMLTTVTLLVPNPTAAQEQPFDSERLLQKLAAVRDDLNLTALGATVLVDGKITARAALGKRRQDADAQVTVDDQWHQGSITKSMTATVLGTLVDDGRLSWDDALPDLLPDMAAGFDASWKNVTLHHVLTHSAGLPANFSLRVQLSRPDGPEALHAKRREELALILQQPSTSAPGQKHVYSNVGYTLAGFIAAEAAGMPWEDLMQQKLFLPLKLQSAGFGPPKGDQPLDQPWGHVRTLFIRTPMNPAERADNTPIMGPAGTVHMSMHDLAVYGWEHLHGEASEGCLLKRLTFQKLHTPVIRDYCYGWVEWKRDWAGGRVLWHNGSNTMWYSLLLLAPAKNAVVVVVTNDGSIQKATPAFFELAEEIVVRLPLQSRPRD